VDNFKPNDGSAQSLPDWSLFLEWDYICILQVFDEGKDTFKTPIKKKAVSRAASTPEGNITHMESISFCMNVSAIPPSPIPTSLPIRIYPKGKGKLIWIIVLNNCLNFIFFPSYFLFDFFSVCKIKTFKMSINPDSWDLFSLICLCSWVN